jgi:hypothetical protein
MSCRACNSSNQCELPAEIALHLPGIRNLDKAAVFAFPMLLVCLDCGFTEMVVTQAELWRLRNEYYPAAAA